MKYAKALYENCVRINVPFTQITSTIKYLEMRYARYEHQDIQIAKSNI